MIKKSFYSIPELSNKDISQYRIISNPGCYPTSIQIPLIPLIKNKLINTKNITIDSKSGYSGAGKNLEKKFTHKNLYILPLPTILKIIDMCEIDEQLFKLLKENQLYF